MAVTASKISSPGAVAAAPQIPSAKPPRVYFDPIVDSRRWERVRLNPDDIIISTSTKSGTTWMQRIVSVLLIGKELPDTLINLSPWVDARFIPVPPEDLLAVADKNAPRRFMKSHVPFDGLPYDPKVKYVCVGRDARDVALSLFNHYSGYSEHQFTVINSPPGTFPYRFEHAPADVHAFIKTWLSKGNPEFPWESDGYPYSSHFHHIQSFWEYRNLPNIFMTHYRDLKTDLAGETARLAAFLGIEPTPDLVRSVVSSCTFSKMRSQADEILPEYAAGFIGGNDRFFHSASLGRWRDVFTPGELALYQAAVQRNLTADCAQWLEHGRIASGIDPAAGRTEEQRTPFQEAEPIAPTKVGLR